VLGLGDPPRTKNEPLNLLEGSKQRPKKKKKKKRAAKSADAHVTKKGGFEMMGRRTRGSNCNSQCQTKHKTQSGANYNANTKVHKLANLRFFSSGGGLAVLLVAMVVVVVLKKAKQTRPNKAQTD